LENGTQCCIPTSLFPAKSGTVDACTGVILLNPWLSIACRIHSASGGVKASHAREDAAIPLTGCFNPSGAIVYCGRTVIVPEYQSRWWKEVSKARDKARLRSVEAWQPLSNRISWRLADLVPWLSLFIINLNRHEHRSGGGLAKTAFTNL